MKDLKEGVRNFRFLVSNLTGLDPWTAGPLTAADLARGLHGVAGDSQIDHDESGGGLGLPSDNNAERPHRTHDLAGKIGALSDFQLRDLR